MRNSAILMDKTRGNIVESKITGHLVVVDGDGITKSFGDPNFFTYIRSASKPFQTIPLITTGAFNHFGLNEKHLAIVSGSHNGQLVHRKLIEEMLSKVGLSEDNLQCGIHPPFTVDARKEAETRQTQLSHNCSGKHTAMLLICCHMGWDIDDYMNPNHPVQILMKTSVATTCEVDESIIETGIDGCGVPVFAMPLDRMAKGYYNFCNPKDLSSEHRDAVDSIRESIQKYPVEYAGTDRIATLLLKDNPNHIFKAGAEGVGCLGGKGFGLAFKIDCGNEGKIFAFVMAKIAEALGCKIGSLSRFSERNIINSSGKVVGQNCFCLDSILD